MTTEMIALVISVATAISLSTKEIIKAYTNRFVRNINKPKIKLKEHPIFSDIPIYLKLKLTSIIFDKKHENKKNIIIDFETIRWDMMLNMLFDLADEVMKEQKTEDIIRLFVSNLLTAQDETKQILLERGFPPIVYEKFKNAIIPFEFAINSLFKTIFRDDKSHDNNIEKFNSYLNLLHGSFEDNKDQIFVALADVNGELANINYELKPYELKINQQL